MTERHEAEKPAFAIPQDPRLATVHIYASGAFTSGTLSNDVSSPAAGYGIYVESDCYRARISEPLPHPFQTRRKALVKALFAALELGHSLRARSVRIVMDDAAVVDDFNTRLPRWRAEGWRHVDDARHWRQVLAMSDAYACRAMAPRVVKEALPESAGLRKAAELALAGTRLHAWCPQCQRNYGRPGTRHECQPVCLEGDCELHRSRSLEEHGDHLRKVHSAGDPVSTEDHECGSTLCTEEDALMRRRSSTVVQPVCPHCQVDFTELANLDEHIEKHCPDILASWFSQTKIVKN